jgi:murein DD-endopeptidase MepM/ murein hydrolase activator NlpD
VHEEDYTIMVVPAVAGKPRRYAISKRAVTGLLIGGGALLVVIALLVGHYLLLWHQVGRYKAERHMIQEEKAKITFLSQSLQRLTAKMAKLEEFDHKLRIIADLPEMEETDESLGVGGMDADTQEALEEGLEDFAEQATALEESIEGLEEQAAFQEESFYELIEFLEDRKSILLGTPSVRPTRGWISSGFGYRKSPLTGRRQFHRAVDFATRIGTPIIATADGIVISSKKDSHLGNIIEIDHGKGFVTRYGHNSSNFVKKGERVKRGQVIGTVGNTGRSTGPHLHYEVHLNGVAVNPRKYMLN